MLRRSATVMIARSIGNGLPFEKMIAGEGHGLLSTDGGRLANALLYGTLPRLCNDTARLIAELGGDIPVRLSTPAL